jgi:hypothetical protein
VITSAQPLDQLWHALGWSKFVTGHPRFPLAEVSLTLQWGTNEIGVQYCDRRTGEYGMITDKQDLYPSEELLASMRLLVGAIDELVAAGKKDDAERQRRWERWQRRERGRY